MHSTIKNSKYKTNGVRNNLDDRNYDDSEDVENFKKKDKKLKSFCIEIEMNESVRNLLSSPEKCHSALLDVTVIKPEVEDEIQTNTMKGSQVRKMLANLDREKRDKKLLHELFEDKAPSEDTIVRISKHNPRRKMQASSDFCYDNVRKRKFLKSQFHRTPKTRPNNSLSAAVDPVGRKHAMYNHCYSPGILQVSPMIGEDITKTDHHNADSEDSLSADEPFPIEQSFRCGDHKKTQHVYAAPRTFKDLNSVITCQSMSKDTRTPCLCEHCGIASLLSETQKRPIITAPVEHASDLRRKMNRKEYKDQISSKHEYRKRSSCEDKNSFQAGLAHMYERVKLLEERMDVQEERAVPKDYFKRIITKIIAHFSPRPAYGNFQLRDSDSSSYLVEQQQQRYKNNYSVNTLMVDKNESHNKMRDKKKNHDDLNKLLDNLTEEVTDNKKTELTDDFWKWGGEILKPGVDLKNKILSLLDTHKKMKKDEAIDVRPKTEEIRRDHEKMRNSGSNRSVPDENKEFNSEAFKSFVEAMSAKIYKSQKKTTQERSSKICMDVNKSSGQICSDSSLYRKLNRSNNEQKATKKSMIPKMSKKEAKSNANKNTTHDAGKKVDVSYMNPKLSSWQEEESQISFRLEFSDADTNTRSNKDSKNKDLEKLEFLRTLSRTKDSDKEKLWESIWSQAKANGQTKQDKVTIQLPRRNCSEFNDMIEIEFTIGEIEYMLTKHKYADKNKLKS